MNKRFPVYLALLLCPGWAFGQAFQQLAAMSPSAETAQDACVRTYDGGNTEDPRVAADDSSWRMKQIRAKGYAILDYGINEDRGHNGEPFRYHSVKYRLTPEACELSRRSGRLSNAEVFGAIASLAVKEGRKEDIPAAAARLLGLTVDAPTLAIRTVDIDEGRYSPLPDGGYLLLFAGSYQWPVELIRCSPAKELVAAANFSEQRVEAANEGWRGMPSVCGEARWAGPMRVRLYRGY